jgi:hypothetical protein
MVPSVLELEEIGGHFVIKLDRGRRIAWQQGSGHPKEEDGSAGHILGYHADA